jgi:hypothetical protein
MEEFKMSLVSNPNKIRLGIIGMSEGNGHPYSWSAIFNGYDQEIMTRECPFAGIPVYLNKETKYLLRITGANVTHIYCDDKNDATRIARCSLIPNIVDKPGDFIGNVDAVIIATDIGSEHVERARPFVEAGLPVFIDKPLCDNHRDLEVFRQWIVEEKRPIMSSSCMRYTKEFKPYHNMRTKELGELRFVSMSMAKKWETYGIHALEAIYPIIGAGFETIRNIGTPERNIIHMTHRRKIEVVITCIYDLQYNGTLWLGGTHGSLAIASNDVFYSFKSQLQSFIDFLRSGKYPFPFSETDELMRLVIGGIESREAGGKVIKIKPMKV